MEVLRDGENPENLNKEEMAFCGTRSFKVGCQKVAYGVSAHFCRVKTPSIAIWANFLFGFGPQWSPEFSIGIP